MQASKDCEALERETVPAARAPCPRRWSDGYDAELWSVPSIDVVVLLSLVLALALG